jgi:SNF2 family DNA or RNA helicase
VVVFCVFKHDLDVIRDVTLKAKRKYFELSGRANTKEEWDKTEGAVIGVQIQAGSEGVDLTKAHHAIYYSIPHSLAQYRQSMARLYRPGQEHQVSFYHLVAEDTVEENMYSSLERKEDIIESIKAGTFDFGYKK